MATITIRRSIAAAPATVFQAVAHIEQFSEAIPHITKVEMLSEVREGVGTRFRETRLMKGREATTELEVTEYEPDQRVRLVADSHGTVWDSLFTVKPEGAGSVLTLTMEARAYRLLSKLMNPLISGMIKKAVGEDMDAVKAFCERDA
ncbi:MAG: SRPBCC family protein [Acidobacteriota bacterium]